MNIEPLESTSVFVVGFNKFAPDIAITSIESPYKYTLTFSPMLNL